MTSGAPDGRPGISAVVLAYNDEPYIRSCLECIQWVDEIIIVDSYSTDETTRISREFTDRIFQHEFRGFGLLRNEALTHASHDWVLSLDTDERVTPDLREEIQRILGEGPVADAYLIPRRNYFLGRWIRHCGWFPDYRQPQFFHKARMQYREDLVHEGYDLRGRLGRLERPLVQYPFRDLDHFFGKMDRYSDLMARRMVEQGRKFRMHQLVTHPVFTFVKMYLIRRGLLDGFPGLILSGLYAYYTFVKYAKLWEMTRSGVRGQRQRGMG